MQPEPGRVSRSGRMAGPGRVQVDDIRGGFAVLDLPNSAVGCIQSLVTASLPGPGRAVLCCRGEFVSGSAFEKAEPRHAALRHMFWPGGRIAGPPGGRIAGRCSAIQRIPANPALSSSWLACWPEYRMDSRSNRMDTQITAVTTWITPATARPPAATRRDGHQNALQTFSTRLFLVHLETKTKISSFNKGNLPCKLHQGSRF
jgi:hypothetical protein